MKNEIFNNETKDSEMSSERYLGFKRELFAFAIKILDNESFF